MKCRHQRITTCIGAMLVWGHFCSGAWGFGAEPILTATNNPALASLTLAEAQARAFQRNWDLLAAAVGVDAATALKIVSHEFPNPTLSLSTTKISVDNHPASTPDG